MFNPFTAVSREEYKALQGQLATAAGERDDAKREARGLRIELQREQENAERLTALAARAVLSVEILQQALIERQIGAKRDPSMVLVVNSLTPAPARQRGFMPLNKRRRRAAKREEAEQLRRTALPKLTAELPAMPLTTEDREAMREVIAQSKESD